MGSIIDATVKFLSPHQDENEYIGTLIDSACSSLGRLHDENSDHITLENGFPVVLQLKPYREEGNACCDKGEDT
jgi:hypothetical protein